MYYMQHIWLLTVPDVYKNEEPCRASGGYCMPESNLDKYTCPGGAASFLSGKCPEQAAKGIAVSCLCCIRYINETRNYRVSHKTDNC